MSLTNLIERLQKRERRVRFVENQIRVGVPFQVRALRDKKKWSQEKLGQIAGMAQTAVCRIENETAGTSVSIRTLLKLASAFDVALVVRFVPFKELLNWVAGEPYRVAGLSSPETTAPRSFGEEDFTTHQGVLHDLLSEAADRVFATAAVHTTDVTGHRVVDYTNRAAVDWTTATARQQIGSQTPGWPVKNSLTVMRG